MAAPAASPLLSEAMLQRFRERAPGYDRDNRFFHEDFDELRLRPQCLRHRAHGRRAAATRLTASEEDPR